MKKYLLLILFWVFISGIVTKAQNTQFRLDLKTAEKLRSDMSADGKDTWATLSMKHKVQFFMKQHFADSLIKPQNGADIGYYQGNGTIVQLNNTKEIELAATSITPGNAGKYLYRVILNDSVELVHWTKPTTFRSNKFITYAYLGKFNCRNKIIKLELYRIDDYADRTEIVFNSGFLTKPVIDWIVFDNQSNVTFHPENMSMDIAPLNKGTKAKHQPLFFERYALQNKPINVQWSEHLISLTIEMRNTLQNDSYAVWLNRVVDGKQEEIRIPNQWQHSVFGVNPFYNISAAYFSRPGKYVLRIVPALKFKQNLNDLAVRIPFTVLPGPTSIPVSKVIFIISVILGTGVYCFSIYRTNMRRHLKQKEKDKQIAALQLASVRSQLNPHFIFNALAGIQNLMNRNETENANKYLSRFARITRSILDDGQKELTTIEQEIGLLRDYLEMEQMRFAFNFEIKIDEQHVDQQIQIPAMLLQPFVENAVKHGVSSLKNEGLIIVTFENESGVLKFSVQDNGKGFIPGNATGMGIKLCSERIALLNSTYKNSNITLHQKSDNSGTLIRIELRDWV